MPLTETQKRETIRAAWLLERTSRVPFMIEVGASHLASARFLCNPAADLAWQGEHCAKLSALDDYFIPNLKPNLGIGIVAAAFGCEWVEDPNADPWIKPRIGEGDPADISGWTLPDPATSGMNALAFERIDYLQQHSDLPLRLVNVPSPLVTASLIWEYGSFISATLLQPREAHALLEIVTEATIEFVRYQLGKIKRVVSLSHEPWYLPLDLGIRISDDTANVMSPRTYAEFGVPYNARISEAFGGIVIHSCGDIGHVLPAMMETPGLRGIDLVAPQNDWHKVRDAAGGTTALCLRYYSWDFPSQRPVDMLAYSRELLDFFGRQGVLLWTQTEAMADATELARCLHRL